MRIRRITKNDRECYVELAEGFYHSPAVLHDIPRSYIERTFDEMMRSDVYVDGFLMEADEGVVMGYALISKTFSQESGGLAVWVEELYVLPEHQGQGVGSQVFALLEEVYPDCCRFRLEIEPDNEGAERLYRRMGYGDLPYRQMVKEKTDN